MNQHYNKTHCKNGHMFTPENTYISPTRPTWRMCRTCNKKYNTWEKRAANIAGYRKRLRVLGIPRSDPFKARARRLLQDAVRAGKIKRPEACQLCGKIGGRIEGHHRDYSKALEVEWLCVICHGKRHQTRPR